jgi:hypothetical protein
MATDTDDKSDVSSSGMRKSDVSSSGLRWIEQVSSSVSWAYCGDLLIAFNRPEPIPDDLFETFVRSVSRKAPTKLLATSTGPASIAGHQRKRFAELFRHCKVSAVSDHRVTRGIITAMGWLGLQIRAASWDNLREAIDYLEPNGTTAADVQALTLKLRDKSMRLDSVA